MYANPFDFESSYAGRSRSDRCPVCGSTDQCPDAVVVALLYPPVDFSRPEEPVPVGGLLRAYTVTVYGTTTVMRLNATDAARYGDAAVLIT